MGEASVVAARTSRSVQMEDPGVIDTHAMHPKACSFAGGVPS